MQKRRCCIFFRQIIQTACPEYHLSLIHIYSLYKGFDLEYSLHVAGASAAANLSEKNSIDGLRPFAEMMELDARYPGVKTW